jgi:hypothetical protein
MVVSHLRVEAQEFGFAFHQIQRHADELQEYPIALSPRVRLAYHFVHRGEIGSVRPSQPFGFTRRQIAYVLKKRL